MRRVRMGEMTMDGIEKFTLAAVAMVIGFFVLMGSFHAGFLVGKYKTQAEFLNNEAQTISETQTK